MRSFLLSFLMLQLLSANQFGTAALQVPQLWQHYQAHCAEEGEMSFTHFLALHYGKTTHEHKNNPNSHDSLPLKTTHPAATVLALPVALPTALFYAFVTACGEKMQPNFPQMLFHEASYLLAIFQPPRA